MPVPIPVLPETIQGLKTKPGPAVVRETIPFATQKEIQQLPADAVVIKVRALALNPTDWKHALLESLQDPNLAIGCDSSGDVVAVGSDVTRFQIGDRVAGFLHGSFEENNGAFAEYARYKQTSLFKLPDTMTYEEAAAFPIPHFTAYQGLFRAIGRPLPSQVKPEDRGKDAILIWGGASAVGFHAIQLSKLSGFKVLAVASKKHHELLKEIGADELVDYREGDVVANLTAVAKQWGNVRYGFDCISEGGTTENCVDVLSHAPQKAKLITVLPPSQETKTRSTNVEIEFILGYALLNDDFYFARKMHYPAQPEEARLLGEYLDKEFPALVAGWQQGKGSSKFRGQKLNVRSGGLDKVIEGMEFMRDGKVSNEKLVYPLN